MFTGLIEEVGQVESLIRDTLTVKCQKVLDDVKLGDSIAVNGVCLTVEKFTKDKVAFHLSSTTIAHTRFKNINSSALVNLERALALGDRLGGHLVTGHIDGVTKIRRINRVGDDSIFEIDCPANLSHLVVKKGSVAIDGISLTVADITRTTFLVTVIPQTLEVTNLKQRRVSDLVHIEVDMFGRYVESIMKKSN